MRCTEPQKGPFQVLSVLTRLLEVTVLSLFCSRGPSWELCGPHRWTGLAPDPPAGPGHSRAVLRLHSSGSAGDRRTGQLSSLGGEVVLTSIVSRQREEVRHTGECVYTQYIPTQLLIKIHIFFLKTKSISQSPLEKIPFIERIKTQGLTDVVCVGAPAWGGRRHQLTPFLLQAERRRQPVEPNHTPPHNGGPA